MAIRRLWIEISVDGVTQEAEMLPLPQDSDGCLLVIPNLGNLQLDMVDLNAGMRAFAVTHKTPAGVGGEGAAAGDPGTGETWELAERGE